MKITQPNNMAVSLQMNSQHICIVCWFGGGGGKLPNAKCSTYQLQMILGGVNYQLYFVHLLIETCIDF